MRTLCHARGFFDPDAERNGQHPQCAFIARFHWLKAALDIDVRQLPEVSCDRFERWYNAIAPERVTLVFASAYMNSPASMFGHTLLRIDSAQHDDNNRLISYAVNHAADTGADAGALFTVRGLSGAYPGYFSLMPYYEKVREYNDLEDRDLWEYELGFTEEEVERLMMHLWELGSTPFPYYFLHQNCSYRLLAVMDVARPGMALADRFKWVAIPTDTIQAVLAQEGMLVRASYRPAQGTRLRHSLTQLNADQRKLAYALAQGEAEPSEAASCGVGTTEQAAVLETAYDYLYYRHLAGDIAGRDHTRRMRELLIARSRIDQASPIERPPTPLHRPDQAHEPKRIGIGFGRRHEQNYTNLQFRPAYHELLDPAPGHATGAQLNFLDTRIRYLADEERVELERLRFFDVDARTPRDRFFQPKSWNVRSGLEQRPAPGEARRLMLGLEGGIGHTYGIGSENKTLAMVSLQGSLWGSRHLDDTVRAGAGPRVSVFHAQGIWLGNLEIEATQYTDLSQPSWRLSVEQGFTLHRNLSLRLSAAREFDVEQRQDSVELALYRFF
ncbi:hypothetical protein CAL65_21435 [Alkalilimnicola ehrlichii]|uniref:Uncharacterized protein n=1 Tax=Alkalilimnicola ehrlichii TaxID=351052 RepID=A0A3E0WI10_9GAMM|nr:hypothetical protein CAL65_21435 [Alkalilimnicola ehrlichii]